MTSDSQKPLVSVVIPAYNRAAFIERTIDSVLNQTYDNIELLVTDDGSSDGTREILEAYAERGELALFRHPGGVNRGQSASINLGMSHAKGTYVCVLDSDDVFAPRKVEVLVEYLEDHPDVGLVYCNGWAIDAQDRKMYELRAPDHEEHNDPNRLLLDCYFILPIDSLIRKEAYDKAGQFEESFRSAQDHDMAIRIAEVTKLAYVPEFLCFYRRHPDSISAKRQDVRWRTGFEILRRAARRYPYRRSTIRKRKALLHFRIGQDHLRRKERLQAIPRFFMAGLLDLPRALKVLFGIEKLY